MTRAESRGRATASATSSAGPGICGLFALAFTVLKLTGHIDWSWWLVLAPLWIPAALVVLILIGFGIVWLALSRAEDRDNARRLEERRRRVEGLRRPEGAPAANEHGPRHKWGPRGG